MHLGKALPGAILLLQRQVVVVQLQQQEATKAASEAMEAPAEGRELGSQLPGRPWNPVLSSSGSS